MSKELKMGPINAATPTPIEADGSLHEASMPTLMRHWLGLGLDGVLLLGSMGEGYFLPDTTRNAFVEKSVELASGKLTLFASAADYSRARMRERALRYAKMGADCIVLCLPVNVPAAKAVADVKAVAEACPIPCAYYDIPINTGTALVLSEILEILKHPNIVAMKDSSGNPLIAQGLTSPEHRPQDVTLLAGNEYATTYNALLGYDGVLHGGGAITGRRVRMGWEAAKAGRLDEAMAIDRELSLFLATVYNRFSRPLQNAAGQKHVLKLLGAISVDHCVEQSLGDADRARVAAAVERHRAWLEPQAA